MPTINSDLTRVVVEDDLGERGTASWAVDPLASQVDRQDGIIKYGAMEEAEVTIGTVEMVDVPYSAPTPGSGPYASIRDRALLCFRDNTGNSAMVVVLGPKEDVFLADDETVDELEASVAAFITWMVTYGVHPRSGAPITSFVSGRRQKVR